MTLMCGAPLTVFCMSGDSTCSRIEEIEHQRPAAAVVAVILEPCCCWYTETCGGKFAHLISLQSLLSPSVCKRPKRVSFRINWRVGNFWHGLQPVRISYHSYLMVPQKPLSLASPGARKCVGTELEGKWNSSFSVRLSRRFLVCLGWTLPNGGGNPMGNKSHQMQPQGPNKRSTGSSLPAPAQYLIWFVYSIRCSYYSIMCPRYLTTYKVNKKLLLPNFLSQCTESPGCASPQKTCIMVVHKSGTLHIKLLTFSRYKAY